MPENILLKSNEDCYGTIIVKCSFCILVVLRYSFIICPFQLTSSGAPFWSGPKRCPHPLEFSTSNVSMDLLCFVCTPT